MPALNMLLLSLSSRFQAAANQTMSKFVAFKEQKVCHTMGDADMQNLTASRCPQKADLAILQSAPVNKNGRLLLDLKVALDSVASGYVQDPVKEKIIWERFRSSQIQYSHDELRSSDDENAESMMPMSNPYLSELRSLPSTENVIQDGVDPCDIKAAIMVILQGCGKKRIRSVITF